MQQPDSRSAQRRRPRWIPALAAIAGIAITAAAGNWQMNRAHEKERLQEAYDRGTGAAALLLPSTPVAAEALRFRRIEVTGEYLPQATVLLDNKVHEQVAGYHVLMPLRIAGSSMHVLINRGWIAAGPDRKQLPEINTPAGTVSVVGTAVLPGRFLELSETGESGPVWQNLTIERFVTRTGLQVQPVIIEQQNDPGDGLVRSWNRPDFGIAKHYGYAVQWFSLCALIVFLYVFFHVRRTRSKENPEDASPPGGN